MKNEQKKHIPVVFITDNNFIMQTGVAIWSLITNKEPDTRYIVYIVTADCDERLKNWLVNLERDDCKIKIIDALLNDYQDIKQLSHIPIACLLKFNICDLIDIEDKLLYIDGDVYIRGDLTELYHYELDEKIIAGVPSLDVIYDGKMKINAGVMLFNAKKMREEKMSDKLIKKRRTLGERGSMDQQTFNLMLVDRAAFLPLKYNFIPSILLGDSRRAYPVGEINDLFSQRYKNRKQMKDDALIIHYATGDKPWKYDFVPCGDEWYKCYKHSPFNVIKIERRGYLSTHGENILKSLKSGGVQGILKKLHKHLKTIIGKNPYEGWG